MVIEERRRELASEGNRRWDLIRWGIYLQVMNAVDIDENNVLKRRQERHLLYPIPLDELSANKLITGNNKGW
ncbi:SusD family protein [compost metagenome]